MATTPTGIPIVLCRECGASHPATRHHCGGCGRASNFLDANGRCLSCIAADPVEPSFELLEPESG